MTNFFNETTEKLNAVVNINNSYNEVISKLRGEIDDLAEEIRGTRNTAAIPLEGEDFGSAFVRHAEEIENLEKQYQTKQKALDSILNMTQKVFPFTAAEILEGFAEATDRYKKESISILEEAALEAKKKYEEALDFIQSESDKQIDVANRVKSVTESIMDTTNISTWVPTLRSLDYDLFINKEHANSKN